MTCAITKQNAKPRLYSMAESVTDIWTILRLIGWGTEYFKKHHVDSPRLSIELLISHVLKLSRFELYLKFDRPLSDEELKNLRGLIKRCVAGEPLQYVTGEAHFYGRTFRVNRDVLIPRPETELLVEEAIRRTPAIRCLDVGTGSGNIAITIALERPTTEIVAIDISEPALQVARENAERMGCHHVEFKHVDFFDDAAMIALGSFDLVVSNPPYIPHGDIEDLQIEVRDHEPELALTDNSDGYRFYKRFVALADHLIREGGNLFVEIGYQQADLIEQMFTDIGFDVTVLFDLDKNPRILWAHKTGHR